MDGNASGQTYISINSVILQLKSYVRVVHTHTCGKLQYNKETEKAGGESTIVGNDECIDKKLLLVNTGDIKRQNNLS